jgi:acyl-CoA-binding protein
MIGIMRTFIIAIISTICAAHPDFVSCAAFVKRSPPADVPEKVKLEIYSLYKQATLGDCPKQRIPWMELNVEQEKKISSWCARFGMTRKEAEKEYVKAIDSMVPNWRTQRL